MQEEECGLEAPGFLLELEELINAEQPLSEQLHPSPQSSKGSTLLSPHLTNFESYNDFCRPEDVSYKMFSSSSILAPNVIDDPTDVSHHTTMSSPSFKAASRVSSSGVNTPCLPNNPPSFPSTPIGSPSSSKCNICFDKSKESVLIPCGHRVGCFSCSEKLAVCPECHEHIKQVLRVAQEDSSRPPSQRNLMTPTISSSTGPQSRPQSQQFISSYLFNPYQPQQPLIAQHHLSHYPYQNQTYPSLLSGNTYYMNSPSIHPLSGDNRGLIHQEPSSSTTCDSDFRIDRSNAEASSLIKEHGKTGDLDSCWAVWHRLTTSVDQGVPNEITLGCMIDALVSNRHVLAAENLVRAWKRRVPPNTVIYSTLIHGWAKHNDARRALGIFHLMRAEGVPCNAVTYNCVIHACVRVGDMDGALNLLQSMKSSVCDDGAIQPDKFTYSTIIKGYCGKGEIEQALSLFDSMLNEGLSPDLVIYNTLLDGCVKRRHHEICDRLLNEMTTYWGIHPNSYTLSILIKRFGRQGDLLKAFEFVEDLPKKYSFKANAHVWTCLISACITQGRMAVAETVFNCMCSSSDVTCSMSSHLSGEDERLISAVCESLKTICSPDAKTYETYIQGCLRFNVIDRAVFLAVECSQKFGMNKLPQQIVEQVIEAAKASGIDASSLFAM